MIPNSSPRFVLVKIVVKPEKRTSLKIIIGYDNTIRAFQMRHFSLAYNVSKLFGFILRSPKAEIDLLS